MSPLQVTDLYLISAMMQTLGALWGIVFVVYVFVTEYFIRVQDRADLLSGRMLARALRDLTRWLSEEEERRRNGSTMSPPPAEQLKERLSGAPEVRGRIERHRKFFIRIIVGGLAVAVSTVIDVVVLWLNDASLVGVAIWGFLLSFAFIALILLWEVATTVRSTNRLLDEFDAAVGQGEEALNGGSENEQ